MTLRTDKGGRDRCDTCSTKARQGETGCQGRTVPMEKPDTLVADHPKRRLPDPERLGEILAAALHHREASAGLPRTLPPAGRGKSAAFGGHSPIPRWRALVDSNHRPTA